MPAGAFPWREDGRCGNATVAPDGSRPAICNPWQPDGLTCCLDTGLCAPSGTPGCVEHKLQQPWRRDGTCGPDIRAIDGSLPSICNPLDPYNNTCCSDQGWCGRSADHCGCRDCMQYGAVCSCLDDAAPCQDPYSGACYPRTVVVHPDDTFDEEDDADDISLDERKKILAAHGIPLRDNLGQLNSIKNLGKDRRPQLDPRKTMKAMYLTKKYDSGFSKVAEEHDQQLHTEGLEPTKKAPRPQMRPNVRGLRCGIGAVDCVATRPPPPPPPPDQQALPPPPEPEGAPPSPPPPVAGAGAAAAAAPAALPKLESIRLADGDTHEDGRVEVRFGGRWGRVCDLDWDWAEAQVACRQLGYKSAVMLYSGSAHGDGDGPVWMSNLHCGGFEHALDECAFFGLNHSSVPFKCDADHDAGVKCANIDTPAPANSATAKKAIEDRRAFRAGGGGVGGGGSGGSGGAGGRAARGGGTRRAAAPNATVRASVDAAGGGATREPEPWELPAALEALEEAVAALEARRGVPADALLARLARLRLRLHRLAGRRVEPQPQPGAAAGGAAGGTGAERLDANFDVYAPRARKARAPLSPEEAEDDELGISPQMRASLSEEMLGELRAMAKKEVGKRDKPLHEERDELKHNEALFEEMAARDPIESYLRNKPPPNFRPPGDEDREKLVAREPYERLTPHPIQHVVEKDASVQQMAEQRRAAIRASIKRGDAPPGWERLLGPGPWDDDPSFFVGDRTAMDDETLPHEFMDDITFPDY